MSIRSTCLVLAAGALAFAAYGSLLPFEFEYLPSGDAVRAFVTVLETEPVKRPSRTDMLANVLLFVPVGFFLAGALLAGAARTVARAVLATIVILGVGVGASLVIEFLQVFTPDRIPSRVDVAAQTVGSVVGILLWGIAGNGLAGWVREAARAAPDDRVSRMLLAYVAGWTLVNLAPFDITVDISDLGRRLRTGKIVPIPFAEPDLLTLAWLWDALAEILAAIPLGLFAGIVARRRPAGTMILPAAGIFALALLTELAQVFIRSHSARATDWLLASCGIVLGIAVARRHSGMPVALSGPRLDRRALALLVLWVGVLCGYHWRPFDFQFDPEAIADKLARISLIPFDGYRSGSYLSALNNLLTKVSLSMPLGVFAGFAVRGLPVGRPALAVISVVAFGGIFGLVELGQAFIPLRLPDPTDVLVGVCSATAGLYVAFWLAPGTATPGSSTLQRGAPSLDPASGGKS